MIDPRLEGARIGLEGHDEKVLVINSSLEGASVELEGPSETVVTIEQLDID